MGEIESEKVKVFWEDHKNMKKSPTFVLKKVGDFYQVFNLLKISELYSFL